jgi:hypothetical protein
MKNPAGILTVAEASRVVRDVIEPYGRIPRDGFICTSNKYGIIKARFILE